MSFELVDHVGRRADRHSSNVYTIRDLDRILMSSALHVSMSLSRVLIRISCRPLRGDLVAIECCADLILVHPVFWSYIKFALLWSQLEFK